MKTKFTIFIMLIAAFVVGCQKEDINPNPGTTTSGASPVHATANYPNGCCCAYHGMIEGQYAEAWVDGPFVWVPAHWGITGYYGCGTHGGSVGSGRLYPTLPTGWSSPTDSMSLTLAPGMEYNFYQNNTFIATVFSDGNGHVDLSDLSAGTYQVHVYFDDAHETADIEMTLPMPTYGWMVKLDEN